MAKGRQLISLLYPFFLAALVLNCHGYEQQRKAHVVYMGDLPKGDASVASTHHNMLVEVLGSSSLAKESLLHSYGRSFNGFVARLSDEEVARIADMEGVVSVFPNTKVQLHTTRSWDFMSFPEPPMGSYEGDVIIGMLDTGIWPESASFRDEGFGPPPAKWKGICQTENNFTCNNKIIGARFYDTDNLADPLRDTKSPRDTLGHGSHTASTAAGRAVENASYYGIASGVARGGVPNARLAVYKVCWGGGCSPADILAAFDDAIADGVDILSISLGSEMPAAYNKEPVAIGSFHAMKNGILTSCSAGNKGPYRRQISNYAPWALTVAASTIDRSFVTKVVLGNGQTILGTSLNNFHLDGTSFPLVYSGDAANITSAMSPDIAGICFPGTLSTLKTRGAVVLCNILSDSSGAFSAEAVGLIMASPFDEIAFAFPVPAVVISYDDRLKLIDYIRTTEYPTATILSTETTTDVMAPTVVSFSSRGPNPISPDILKPDVTAPGSNILAAWSPRGLSSVWVFDDRQVDYYIISGTSMSCPHVTGAAAYIKATHPTWSAAAIKSALMTTATIMDPRKNEDAEFAYGSGHINPLKAVDPGLVFDASEADYVDFLCKQGYNTTHLRMITGDSSVCPSNEPGKAWDLNYPSFGLSLLDGEPVQASYLRTVTNVGSPNSTYHSNITMPPSFAVLVEPPVLTFSEVGEKKSFKVIITGSPIVQVPVISGAIEWTDGNHVVRTPIAVFNNKPYVFAPLDDYPGKKNSHPFQGSTIYHQNGIFDAVKF
ncbi:cucumisin-like [Vitis riparia]|uniref:cucumisin-like n=1 Tax=Vitis riparia TaxID=96939 RepID=UPI00155AEF49|nr:cucumisin-like [Vitis riparia]